jgi:hypothetical protein
MLRVGQPTLSSWVGDDMIREAGFRKAVRPERGAGKMMVYPLAPIAERLEKGPTMWGQWGFCEEEKILGVVVQYRNDVDQGGAVGPRLFNVYNKEFKFYGQRGGGCRMAWCRGQVSSGRCWESITVRGRGGPLWACLG